MQKFKRCHPSLLAIVIFGFLTWPGDALAKAEGTCEVAILQAEKTVGMPDGLLLAIGRVEARYRDIVWPWSLNIGGKPIRHHSYRDALTHVRKLTNQGTNNIDVGCLQLNLIWVARGLPIEDVLKPNLNALWAAQHLFKLKQNYGTWTRAVARYHSFRTSRQKIYVCKVAREYAALLNKPMPDRYC